MSYAVMQKELMPLSLEVLQRAFRAVPGLTAFDAHTIRNDAFGILVKNFPKESAVAMQGALRSEGIETEIVDQNLLPSMPQTKFVNRLACSEAGLEIYDPIGRSFLVEWGHVMLMAAGAVTTNEFVRRVKERPVTQYSGDGSSYVEYQTEVNHKEERVVHLLLEIVLTRAVMRYSITADKFDFRYLAERRTKNVSKDFLTLAGDLAKFAPHAGLNRGMTSLLDERGEIFSYPSKNAFFEEIIWMLWRIARPQA